MKKWTIEALTELWMIRGYSKKKAAKIAEIEYKKMNSKTEFDHQDMQEILYN